MTTISTNKRQEILKELDKYKSTDFDFASGHILGSMCCQPHPLAREAYINFLETNLGDPELFSGTKKLESHLIKFFLSFLYAPPTAEGLIVSGGTEGNITAMWIAKQLTHKKEVILPESAHFSFSKIASLMDLHLIEVPLTDAYTTDISKVEEKISNKTAAVIGIAGSTELGTIDPLPDLSNLCADEHLFLHVDAAFGGFVIPFLQKLGYTVPNFDFQLQGVHTISVDAHKMGYSAIPLGALLIREGSWFDQISVDSPYISAEKHTGLLGTRSGGPVAAAYAVTQYLGMEGYTKVVQHCMEVTKYTSQRIQEIGLNLVLEPTMNVLGVKLHKLSEIVEILASKGWKVNKMARLSSMRIVCMPQITKHIIDEFIPVLEKTCRKVGEL